MLADRVGKFVLKVMVIYILLVIPWPGWKEAYGALTQKVANMVFGTSGDVRVWFRPIKDVDQESAQRGRDIEIALRERGSPYVYTTPLNTRLLGYLPTAAVVALVLATAIPWSRRWKALLWGLLCVHLFIALRLYLALAYSHTVLGDPEATRQGAAYRLYEIGTRAPTVAFIVPVLIWILVTFRRSDFEALAGEMEQKKGEDGG